MLKKHFYKIAYLSWMVFVTWSSLFSFKDTDLPKFEIPYLDKAVHFTFYFMAVVLGMMAVREYSKGRADYRKSLFYTFLAMLFFGIIIEVVQYAFTLDRTGDIFDGVANAVGALFGVLAIKLLFSRNGRLNWKQ
ncbi:VanZ family protein [Maribacter halichondriae]|uniref:VanZ family protein n=1 Tax=Maribacter halichondriae TaxID=2980554 RepID=UPI002359B379|nr:VanZ family protein [Maribacter sp. Hal144]